jgi:hypothetical protein
MTITGFVHQSTVPLARPGDVLSPALSRSLLALALVAGATAGVVTLGEPRAAEAAKLAGPDLARLLRAMAALKVLMAAPLVAAVAWRLGVGVSPVRLLAYVAAVAAMAAGPGLIWSLAHVRWGALLQHGGLLATLLLLWRDPAVRTRLSAAIAGRRAILARTAPPPSAGR